MDHIVCSNDGVLFIWNWQKRGGHKGALEGIGVCQESGIMKEVAAGISSRGLWVGELLSVGFEEEVMGENPKATKVVNGEGNEANVS
jgi:hypothetical protein